MYRTYGMIGLAITLAAAPITASHAAEGQKFTGEKGVELDAPYVPTPQEIAEAMLTMAEVGPDDIVYDLGSGDGRLVISAVRDYNAKKGVGVDLDPVRVAEARANAKAGGVADRAIFYEGDLFEFDFSEATVLTMYLLPDMILKLRPTIQSSMKPGSRVVAHDFHMGDWVSDKHQTLNGRTVYYWVVPARVGGTWEWRMGRETYRADITQTYQAVAGTLSADGAEGDLQLTSLVGDTLKFEARLPGPTGTQALAFNGKVDGDTITATVIMDGRTTDVTATRMKTP